MRPEKLAKAHPMSQEISVCDIGSNHMLKLKNFELKSRILQSPMANCTDLPFRLVAREKGMEFAFLEMISAEALLYDTRTTREILKTVPEDRPLGAQLVGCNADRMGEAGAVLEGMGFDWIDINLGCKSNHFLNGFFISLPITSNNLFNLKGCQELYFYFILCGQ